MSLSMLAATSVRVNTLRNRARTWLPFIRSVSYNKNNKETLELQSNVRKIIEEDGLQSRRQPGSRNNPTPSLPLKLHLATLAVINRYRSKNFRAEVEKIWRNFNEVFVEDENSDEPMMQNKRMISADTNFDIEKDKMTGPLKSIREMTRDYLDGEPFTHTQCAAYMASRLMPNYAAIKYIFNEIRREEPDFEPSTLFDYGSGVGTTIWAADETWKKPFKEIFCVDLNENMNDLNRELLQKGTTHCDNILDKTFFRQFLPVKHRPGYDLVVSGFSLLDFHDTRSRIYMVENLWKKTDGMLVLVEHGSRAGFTAIMEARNFLLQISKRQLDPLKMNNSKAVDDSDVNPDVVSTEGSIVAPCPHDQICPRLMALQKKSFCNFATNYYTIDIGQANRGIRKEKFAYLVMKKHNYAGGWSELQKTWPRVVEPTLTKKGFSICRLCTNVGELQEFYITKARNDRTTYDVCRRTKWGDRIPAAVVPRPAKTGENATDAQQDGNDEEES